MRAFQKLVQNGNSTQVTIPRQILIALGWIPGRAIVVELTEDCRSLVVRPPCERDFGVTGPPRIISEPLVAPR